MKAKTQFGLAILTIAFLLLHPLGACASMSVPNQAAIHAAQRQRLRLWTATMWNASVYTPHQLRPPFRLTRSKDRIRHYSQAKLLMVVQLPRMKNRYSLPSSSHVMLATSVFINFVCKNIPHFSLQL